MRNKPKNIQLPPWMTEDGYLDFTKLPLDGILRQTLNPDPDQLDSACRTLGIMLRHGREEAGVYLVGLFLHFRGDLDRAAKIVAHLPHAPQTAALLADELRQVKSSNITRKYLNLVLETLARFPRELAEERLEELCLDRAFTARMREKFRLTLAELRRRAFDHEWE